MSEYSIRRPELLRIREGNTVWEGADQIWYPLFWQRRAGCGPTTASHLMWYLSRTKQGAEILCPYDGSERAGFVRLMQDMWRYVTPGMRGANSTSFVSGGAVRYGQHRNFPLTTRVLEIPAEKGERPSIQELMEFLSEAAADDLAVAFLNLSNGALKNLDNWHWVTLTGVDTQWRTATMVDQRSRSTIDMDLWLKTTTNGGGFVVIEPEKNS